jgi:putative membrane protein
MDQQLINFHYVVNSLVFSVIGIVMLIAAFVVVDIITPRYHLWREIVEKQNIAMAVLLAGFLLGVAVIIAAAVHG